MRWLTRGGHSAGTELKTLLADASEEMARRGERRLGTDHLLLALLHEPHSPAAEALGVALADARAAADGLDVAALAAIGVVVGTEQMAIPERLGRRFPPLTSGARDVLQRAIDAANPRHSGHIGGEHVLLALMARHRPDPAAELLHTLGIDLAAAQGRLGAATNGDPA